MANAARTFRIFVSSTFSDLKAERDALQALVFPRLRDLCARHGCRFQAIDLRWGVRDEAALDQQTMRICLDEVTRSQRASPKPNFIVLLGDRYGWQPLPAEIPAGEFERIAAATAATDDRVLLAAWYARDDNARVRSHEGADAEPIYCLRPRSGRFTDFAVWDRDVEQPLRRILRRGIEGLGIDANARRTFEASATEQEIAAGALKVADAGEHVFCFFRRIDGVPVDRRAADFIDLDAEGAADAGVQAKLDALRRLLEERLPGNVHAYRATWAGDGPSTAHIGSLPASLDECLALLDAADRPSSLCVDVWTRLAPVIAAEIARLETTHALEREIASHAAFAEERARVFVGRAAMLDTIARYLAGDDPHPLAVWGESGSGKSALMAKVLSEAARRHGGAAIVARFIGATPASSDGRSLVEGLCRQISRIHGADESAIPADYQGLTAELAERLKLASAERPLILLLDALDQLSDADRARGLAWLPGVLPAHVRLVVSSLPGGCKAALDTKLGAERVVKLDPMPAEEAGPLLDTWLAEAGRTLQPAQRDAVLSAFGRSAAQDAAGGAAAGPSGMPLYLRLAFEEARRWTSYTPAVNLAPDIPGVIRQLFARLRADANHGEALVSRGLGCLAASKHGLSEDEIIDVLSLDEDVRTDFMARARHTPPEARLPVIVWSRLYFDLEPYLTERVADGTSLLTFYHRQLREAAEAEFLAGPSKPMRHAQLAAYFAAPALFESGDAHAQLPQALGATLPTGARRTLGRPAGDARRFRVPRSQVHARGSDTIGRGRVGPDRAWRHLRATGRRAPRARGLAGGPS